ncbi:hypothetical protein ACE6H2_007169 [Prunus campanulata]
MRRRTKEGRLGQRWKAVKRYGTYRWEAVARCIATRTWQECKHWWVNWLDPQIRTDEWSEIEDVKLRRLSELLPTQWQTISDLFNGNRNAMDCHLRHMFLLENPQQVRAEVDLLHCMKEMVEVDHLGGG